MLNKRLSRLQWLSLIFLFLGVAVVQLQPAQATPIADSGEQSIMIGLSAVCAASMMSGFAGVYFEKLLKHTSPSIFLRNVQLGVIGIVFGLVATYFNDGPKVSFCVTITSNGSPYATGPLSVCLSVSLSITWCIVAKLLHGSRCQ